MTEKQLREGQEIKRIISKLEDELEKLDNVHPTGVNVFLPVVGTIIEDVKQVFVKHLNDYNDKFMKL